MSAKNKCGFLLLFIDPSPDCVFPPPSFIELASHVGTSLITYNQSLLPVMIILKIAPKFHCHHINLLSCTLLWFTNGSVSI